MQYTARHGHCPTATRYQEDFLGDIGNVAQVRNKMNRLYVPAACVRFGMQHNMLHSHTQSLVVGRLGLGSGGIVTLFEDVGMSFQDDTFSGNRWRVHLLFDRHVYLNMKQHVSPS